MTQTTEPDKPNLFDKYFQVPEDEIEWELDKDHPSAWWDLYNSYLEYPEDEFDWVDCKGDLVSDEAMASDIADDDGPGG